MASWSDEIKQSVNTVVAESGVTFDARLFSQNIVVLSFEVADNLTEAEWDSVNHWNLGSLNYCNNLPGLIVNLIAKPRGINNGQRNARSLFVQFQFYDYMVRSCHLT